MPRSSLTCDGFLVDGATELKGGAVDDVREGAGGVVGVAELEGYVGLEGCDGLFGGKKSVGSDGLRPEPVDG